MTIWLTTERAFNRLFGGHGYDPNLNNPEPPTGEGGIMGSSEAVPEGSGIDSEWDEGAVELWDGDEPANIEDQPTGWMVADFTPTQGGAFDVDGSQHADWAGTAFISSTPTFAILRTKNNSARVLLPLGTGGLTFVGGPSVGVGDRLTISGGQITGSGNNATFEATLTRGQTRIIAELPRITMDTSMAATPAPNGTVLVYETDDLQSKINSAAAGQIVALEDGGVWTLASQITWPIGGATRLTTMGSLPSAGVKMTSGRRTTYALPKIVAPVNAPAIFIPDGVDTLRIHGVEVTCAPNDNSTSANPLIQIGGDAPTPQGCARNIVIDQCYVVGQQYASRRVGISYSGAYLATIHSTVTDIHYSYYGQPGESNSDSAAIAVYGGQGPFHVEHNTLSGSHECFVSGSSGEPLNGQCPSDLTFRRNYLTRPTAWRGVQPYTQDMHTCKTVFEFKKIRRALIEANVLENDWVDNQSGSGCMLYGGANGPRWYYPDNGIHEGPDLIGQMPWCNVCDATFRQNLIMQVAIAFIFDTSYSGPLGEAQCLPTTRLYVHHNVVVRIGVPLTNNPGTGAGFNVLAQLNNSTSDLSKTMKEIVFEHNTFANSDLDSTSTYPSVVQTGAGTSENPEVKRNFIFRSNLTLLPFQNSNVGANTAMIRTGDGNNQAAWNRIAGVGCSWDHNGVCAPAHYLPSTMVQYQQDGNLSTNNGNDIGWADWGAFYSATTVADLSGLIPSATAVLTGAHDGTMMGADVEAVQDALAGVMEI